MHSTRVFAAVAAVALLASVANSTIIDCTPAGAIASGLKVSISPTDPQPGASYTYQSSYTLSETVSGGTAKYEIYLDGLQLSKSTHDLCTDLAKTQTPCPLKKGPITSTTKGSIPSDTPSGNLTSVTNWYDSTGTPILCINLQFNEN